jgi:tetratricopeptide (TPR) repeat protein
MPFNHPTFIITAFKNIPTILMEYPELLLRSSSWMKLVILKNVQLQNYKDFFFLIGIPFMQLSAIILTLVLFVKIKTSFKKHEIRIQPLIKLTSFAAGLIFLFLPIFIFISNPKKSVAEINYRRNIAQEINKLNIELYEDRVRPFISLNNDQIYYKIAVNYLNHQQTEKAEKYLDRSILDNPKNIQAKYALASIYHKTNRVRKAIITLEESLEINPDNPEHANTNKTLGIIYLNELRDYDKASIYFSKSIELAPDQKEAAKIEKVIKSLQAMTNKN